MTQGYIMQVQNFCVNDGEGIRTVVFLSGCPLKCMWCANPEGQTLNNPMTSLTTVEEVMIQIKKQMIFYRFSGGGVTFSGGEATVQEEFLRALTQECFDMGIDIAIETCGYFTFKTVEDILRKMNRIFFDIKHMNPDRHMRYTNVSNVQILENLKKTAQIGVPLVVRVPVIHGVNAEEKDLQDIFSFVKENAPEASIELLPYHTLGEYKYEKLGQKRDFQAFSRPSDERMRNFRNIAEKMGISTVSYL